jgi:hypothetical protein
MLKSAIEKIHETPETPEPTPAKIRKKKVGATTPVPEPPSVPSAAKPDPLASADTPPAKSRKKKANAATPLAPETPSEPSATKPDSPVGVGASGNHPLRNI